MVVGCFRKVIGVAAGSFTCDQHTKPSNKGFCFVWPVQKRFLLVLLLVIALGCGFTAFGTTRFSGKWESGFSFDVSGPTLVLQTDSYTYSKLTLNYTLTPSPWTFGSVSTFDTSGLSMQEFSASGSLGLLILSSRLTFSPMAGTMASLFAYSNSTNTTEHTYDLGRTHFVNQVSVTSITMNPAGSTWGIRASRDSATGPWVWSAGPFVGPVQVVVNELVQYVQIYNVGGTYVDDSSVTISVSGQALVNTARLVFGGVTFDGTLTIATGGSSCSLGVTGPQDQEGVLPTRATAYFDIATADCSICFDRFEATVDFSFACLDEVTAALKIKCPQTSSETVLDELSLATEDIDIGLSWLTFDLKVAFMVLSKTVTLTPTLNLGSCTCFKVYSALSFGAGPWEITELSFYGIGVKHDWNGVSFESLSYLDGIHHVKDTYWEKFVIKNTGDACCGGNIAFEVATYFQETHTSLFDWAETDFELSIDITSAFTATTNIVIDTTGVTDLILGIEYSW